MADENEQPEDETAKFETITDEGQRLQPAPEEGGQGDSAQGEATQSEESQSEPSEQGEGQNESGDEQSNASDDGETRPKRRSRGGRQKRIKELSQKYKAEKERADKLAEENAKLRGQSQGQGDNQGEKQSANQSEGEEPDPGDFDTWDDYVEALTKHKAGQTASGAESAPSGERDNESQDAGQDTDNEPDHELEAVLEELDEVEKEMTGVYEDYHETVHAEDLPITRDMVVALADTEQPGEIAYYLGKHKQEAARIAQLESAVAQAREIGKIEAQLQKSGTQKPGKKQTQAPEPVNPVSGSGAPEKGLENTNFQEFESRRNAQETERGGFW